MFPVLEERPGSGPQHGRAGAVITCQGPLAGRTVPMDGIAPGVASPSSHWSIVHTQQCFLPAQRESAQSLASQD